MNDATYSSLLSDKETISKLGSAQPTELGCKTLPELLAKKNVLALTKTPYGELQSIVAAFSEIKSDGDKLLLILADHAESDSASSAAEALGFTCYIEAGTEDDKPTGKIDSADVVIGTPEQLLLTVQEKSFQPALTACVGFAASRGQNLPSAELESVLESVNSKQTAWMSTGVPLAMSSLVNKYVKTNDVVEIDLLEENSAEGGKEVAHEYYEVSRDLLSKPNALCDLIDIAGRPATLIFCNLPSDTDLIEVMLKKRGILAKKMIGHVPDRAVHSAMDEVRAGTIQALVVTDISARSVSVDDFAMIINHATPEDPEVYLHRMGTPASDGKLERIVSLVGSTDLGNFHYLKKIVEFDFVQKELPSDEEKAKAVVQNIIDTAKGKDGSYENEVIELAKALTESGELDVIIPYLVNNTIRVIPELESQQGKKRRGDKNRRQDRYEDEENYNGRESRGDRGGRGERGGRDRREQREERVPMEPAKKDVRFYFGAGTSNGLSEGKLSEIATKLEIEGVSEWKRYTLRDIYAFADIPEEFADEALEKLKEVKLEDGSDLFCCKATEISEPRKPAAQKDEAATDEGASSEETPAEASEESLEAGAPA